MICIDAIHSVFEEMGRTVDSFRILFYGKFFSYFTVSCSNFDKFIDVLNTGRGNLQNMNLRMNSTSPGPTSIQNNNPMGVQINQHQPFGQTSQPSQQPNSMAGTMPSAVQSKLGSATSGNQMMPTQGQTMTTAAPSNMPMQPVSGILPMSQSTSQQGQQPNNPSVTTKDRRTIWQGVLEFQEKSNSPQVQGQRVTHSLPCTFSSMVTNNGEPDV